MEFRLISDFKPQGDQPQAINEIVKNYKNNKKLQTLLGVTGSGKTFTVANIIKELKKPTLILAHNKILAAQLCSEFREFFPENAVEYFVSYYDYYQPEAYVASSDTYIEKDSAVNEEIEKLRHSATSALFERDDVIIVASVSCIYGLGNPNEYKEMALSLRVNMKISLEEIIDKLITIQYVRNDINFTRSTFRVRGDVIEVMSASTFEKAIRIEMFGDEIEQISEIDYLTGKILSKRTHVVFFPASHYVVSPTKIEEAILNIENELNEQVEYFKANEKFIEAQRIKERTNYDIEMLREIGFCTGVENYSRFLEFRERGSRPYTLIDYFPKDFLLVIDESHVTIPQVRGMYAGDISRKTNLVEYGFRLPSALDNRPLNFNEFESLLNQVLYVSATPSKYELEKSESISEQLIRPTGIVDPIIEIRETKGQIDDLYEEILKTINKKERVLITTLTKKMSEDLTTYLKDLNIKVKYMHSDIDALERMEIIRDLRLGEFDVLVGINLLREGLDIPEVSLVAILDADKEGFLRSETSLIQTIGRAARNVNGHVVMYADRITNSMEQAIKETERRRKKQIEFNKLNNIVPKTVKKVVHEIIEATKSVNVSEEKNEYKLSNKKLKNNKLNKKEIDKYINELTEKMHIASENLDFEEAMKYRDEIKKLKIENNLL